MQTMPAWTKVKPWVDAAVIVTGVGTVALAVFTLSDMNHRENLRLVQDVQTAILYRVIDTHPQGLDLEQLNSAYVTAAIQETTLALPREELAPNRLYLILTRLMQAQAIIKTPEGRFVPKVSFDPAASIRSVLQTNNDLARDIASQVLVGWKALSAAAAPLTIEQLKSAMIKDGGDKVFLDQNMPLVVQQMQMQGFLSVRPDGNLVAAPSPAAGGVGTFRVQIANVPPEFAFLKGNLTQPVIHAILTGDPTNPWSICFDNIDKEFNDSLYRKLTDLELIKITGKNLKPNNPSPGCQQTVSAEPTAKFAAVQQFLYDTTLMWSNR